MFALEVRLVPSTSCALVNEAFGRIEIDPNKFELANDADQLACVSRHQIPDSNVQGQDLITWQLFGSGSIASCPNAAGIGTVDVIKVRIKPGTPAGDYDLGGEASEVYLARVPDDGQAHRWEDPRPAVTPGLDPLTPGRGEFSSRAAR